jgi:hypothetical protein
MLDGKMKEDKRAGMEERQVSGLLIDSIDSLDEVSGLLV